MIIICLEKKGIKYVWCKDCPKSAEKFVSLTPNSKCKNDGKWYHSTIQGIDNAIKLGFTIIYK